MSWLSVDGAECRSRRRSHAGPALAFAVVSGLAFGVDMAVLALLVHGLGWPGLVARAASILAATSGSWFIHRHATFSGRARRRWLREWLHYLAVNAIGMTLNYGCYALIMATSAFGPAHPLLAVIPGGVLAMGLNYALASRWVFVPRLSSHR